MSLPNEVISTLLGGDSGYQIERSLRFNSADSAFLNRTPAVAGNRRTWTWSGWVKRCGLTDYNLIFMGRYNGTNYDEIRWNSDDKIYFFGQNSGSDSYRRNTTPVYRDVSSWYHLVAVLNTPNATAADRVKLYVNGVEVTTFSTSTNPTQNFDSYVNNTNVHLIGGNNIDSMYSNQYLTEINFIDGTALDPTYFGETNPATGMWNPIEYTGTYGTNGFYLNFTDNSNTTAATLGKDSTGNGNNWTPNNLSVTAGAGEDSMIDTPTSNYCTLNPLDKIPYNGSASISNGNLEWVGDTTGSSANGFAGSIAVNSGKWYWETAAFDTGVSFAPEIMSGIISGNIGSSGFSITDSYKFYYNRTTSLRRKFEGTAYVDYSSYYGGFTSGDIWMIAFDANSGKLWYGKNGSWYSNASGSKDPATGINPDSSSIDITKTWRPAVASYTSQASGKINFGQRTFAYTAPSGFKALCDTNIAEGTITTSGTFTGNASADGPFVYLNGVPTAMTINSNSVTFGTHADKLSNGFKVRDSTSTYNVAGSNTFSVSTTGAKFKFSRAQPNP